MAPAPEFGAQRAEFRGVRNPRLRPGVRHQHPASQTPQEPRRRDAAGARPEDERGGPRDLAGAVGHGVHRSFSVRSVASAQRTARIQNRMVTCGSPPAGELEVVVERRHPEEPAPGELEARDLQDHRGGLEGEDAPDQDQQDFLADQDRLHGDRPRRAPAIPHPP